MAETLTLRAGRGDTLDALIWRERGLGAGDVAAVLALNPGTAAIGAILPRGTPIIVPAPARPAPPTLPLLQLWD